MLRHVPLEPESLRFAGRGSTKMKHRFGPECTGDPLVPQKEIRVPQHGCTLAVRAGPQLRGRIREDRPAQRRREIGDGGAELRPRVHRAARDDTAFARVRDLHEPFEILGLGSLSAVTYSGVGLTAAIARADLRLGCGRTRCERIAEWQIEVDGARRGAAGPSDRPTAHFTRVSQHSRIAIGNSGLGKPTHVRTVKMNLVDRLPRAPFAQFRRPIGAEYDQRNVGVVGLDHCRIEIRRRRTGCADERGGRTSRLRSTDGKKPRGPLVDLRPTAEQSVLGGSDRKGCGARPRADADLPHARASEFIDEGCGKKMGRIRSTRRDFAGIRVGAQFRSPSAGRAWRAA